MLAIISKNKVTSMTRRHETPSQKQAKANLIRLFSEYKKKKASEGIKVTHDYIAQKMGVDRSLVGQELGKHMPIEKTAAERWAKGLGVNPWDIHPDIEEPIDIDLEIMEKSYKEVMDVIEMEGVQMPNELIGRIASKLYIDCKRKNIRDSNQIRERAKLALFYSAQ